MGSLTSGPSVPRQPQVVFVPQPVSTQTGTAAATTSENSADSNDPTPKTSEEAREQSLLSRDRSRFGTIQTSFRGLLGLGNQAELQPRKTLLGE